MKKLIYTGILSIIISYSLTAQAIINANVAKSSILIIEEDINTPTFEFAPTFYGPYIAFVNDRQKGGKYDIEKQTPYFDLSFAGANVQGNLSRKASFSSGLSSENQEGPFCFNKEENTMLFTRTEPISGLLKIYEATWQNGDWSVKGMVKLGNKDAHICHPTLSDNGYFIVYASAPNFVGSKMDLYISRKENDQWSLPTKIEGEVNSEMNDWFPRFVGDSILIFASDRIGGLGGLDMYASKKINNQWSKPERLPEPLNSPGDDLGMIVGKEIAYFSSDRQNGKGKDDLYRIEYKGDLFNNYVSKKYPIQIEIKNKLSLESVPGAKISVIPVIISDFGGDAYFDIDIATQEAGEDDIILKLKPKPEAPTTTLVSNTEGQIEVNILKNQRYVIKISAAGYNNYSSLYAFEKYGDKLTYVLEPNVKTEVIEPEQPKNESTVIIPTKRGSVIVFENIYYDFNSYNIQSGAAVELDALAETMNVNPNMKVRLSAHTDSRGTKKYNEILSANRANSARNYLVEKGILYNRISTIGNGESQLRNHCKDFVKCSEEEHSFNRRTEVTILEN